MYQSTKAKIGEVILRQKLVKQHLGETSFFAGAPDHKQILSLLKERVANTRRLFKAFPKDVILSPFLEIGAEKGQRSSLLTSDFNCWGFALDLSMESLNATRIFARKLNLRKTPILICANAENLPFVDSSFPFVFAFETLHHFPKPDVILSEMRRVTSPQGHIFFSEEPVKQSLNLRLWQRDYNLTRWEKILKYLLILPFISGLGGVENQFHVIETEFSIGDWQKSLQSFKSAHITLEPVFWGPKSKFEVTNGDWRINPLTRILIALQGGGITALVQKEGSATKKPNKLLDFLICPNCKKNNLRRFNGKLLCRNCESDYPIYNQIIMMLVPSLRKRLYPNL